MQNKPLNKPISISQFIKHFLFDEKIGYYKTKNPIGKDSDFITAPEISQVFGEILAAYILEISSTKNKNIALVEMGAGKGTLFFDILSTINLLAQKKLKIAEDFLRKTSFNIVEINPVLQKIQKEKLAKFNVNWHDNFEDFTKENKDVEIFFISNELLDCFAIDQYILTESGWRERLIDLENKVFTLAPLNKQMHNFINEELNETSAMPALGAVFEVSFELRDFIKDLCQKIKSQGGLVINIDYGYFKTEFANSLQAIKNHKKCDIFSSINQADITAHVDFGALDKIAKNLNCNTSFITQKTFLESLGINERKKALIAKSPTNKGEINLAIDRLVSKDKMGELFKVHIIWQ